MNNGVLLLVAVKDRQSRIEVGYGLEGPLPDAKTGQIQDEYLIPYFQKGDYDQGVWQTYLALTQLTAREYNADIGAPGAKASVKSQTHQPSFWDTLPWWAKIMALGVLILLVLADWILLGGFFTGMILSLLFRRGGGGGGGSGGGGYGGGSGGGGGSNRNW